MTLILALRGARGSRVLLSSIEAPEPFADQCSGLMPQPMNSAANRLGHANGTPAATGVAPQTGTDSSHGSAMVTPTPRRNVRRDRRRRSDWTSDWSDPLMVITHSSA